MEKSGTFRRSVTTEVEDHERIAQNIKGEVWASWPNEAGFLGLDEHRGPVDLKISGHIPSWAAGSLFRTGPGKMEFETSKGTHTVSHWFDGFAHTHRFDIISTTPDASATVKYSSRMQAKQAVEDVKRRGWRASVTFAQKADPCIGIFSKMMSLYRPAPGNNNVVIERNAPWDFSSVNGQTEAGHLTGTQNIFAMTDNSHIQELHPDTLEPVQNYTHANLDSQLSGPMGCAHSQRDPQTGDLFNFNLAYGRRPTYRVFRVNASTGAADILATISLPQVRPAYIHSLFLTESYVVLCVPSTHVAFNGLKILAKYNIAEAIEPFDSSKLMQWLIIDRRGGKGVVAQFATPAGFFFHSVNAFEEQIKDDAGVTQTTLNLDYVEYETLDIIQGMYLDIILNRNDAGRKFYIDNNGYKASQYYLRRRKFTIPPEGSQVPRKQVASVTSESLAFSIPGPHCGELPTINPSRATLRYRYVYSAGTRGLSTMMDCLVKTDLETRDAKIWAAALGHTPGEPIFVARPHEEGTAAEEDDGVVLSVILDGTARKSYLLVLDACSMEELGRAAVDFALGLGFHGVHAPQITTK